MPDYIIPHKRRKQTFSSKKVGYIFFTRTYVKSNRISYQLVRNHVINNNYNIITITEFMQNNDKHYDIESKQNLKLFIEFLFRYYFVISIFLLYYRFVVLISVILE